jgi:hypothetical protein
MERYESLCAVREIPLTKGYVALVDDEDFERVSAFKWCAWRTGPTKPRYAVSCIKGKNTLMHRFIMGAMKGQIIDHVDRNGLNNKRDNLRPCTYRDNNINKATRTNVSGYRGVERLIWNGNNNYRVRVDQSHVGTFNNAKSAAHTYDCVARIRHGKFARTNFPYRWPDALARDADGETVSGNR